MSDVFRSPGPVGLGTCRVRAVERAVRRTAWTPADGLGVWVHGRVTFLAPGEPQWHRLDRHLVRAYDQSPSDMEGFGSIVYARIDPHWMVGFAMTADERIEMEAARAGRQKRLSAPVTNEEL